MTKDLGFSSPKHPDQFWVPLTTLVSEQHGALLGSQAGGVIRLKMYLAVTALTNIQSGHV